MPISGAELSAWVAAMAGALALVLQLKSIVQKRTQERDEMEQALDHQPLVREQLELGNVGEAVKHLNVIIDSQASHIRAQDQRLATCEESMASLSKTNEKLEAEIALWRERTEAADRRAEKAEAEQQEQARVYARTLVQLRHEIQDHSPHHHD